MSTVHYLSLKPCQRQTKCTFLELEAWESIKPLFMEPSTFLSRWWIPAMARHANVSSHTKNTAWYWKYSKRQERTPNCTNQWRWCMGQEAILHCVPTLFRSKIFVGNSRLHVFTWTSDLLTCHFYRSVWVHFMSSTELKSNSCWKHKVHYKDTQYTYKNQVCFFF